ncbi:alkaline ceramidase [Histoplasma ohiense]|nr:alkaline ceramidase [Histoplasma ohiense (nom. inval.)]
MFRVPTRLGGVVGFTLPVTRRSLGDSDPESITYTSRPINFERKRELHGALMTILFMILFPIGSLSMHLRIKVCIAPYIHALIQTIGIIMAIMAVALGINLTSDLKFWNPLRTHVIVGLVATGIILFIQPALGIVQHHYFGRPRAGYVNSRIFGVMHRWLGRVAVVLGMANSGLGFQLVGGEENVPKGPLVWNFVLMGVFILLWFSAVLIDFLGRRRERPVQTEREIAEAISTTAWENGGIRNTTFQIPNNRLPQ